MRCDLHVHTDRSDMCTIPVLRRICRESYNHPLQVYSRLRRRGMDFVVSDHNSIDAAECLRRFPDFRLSEEVTRVTPAGTQVHVGVYDRERDHVAAYLTERDIFFTANHVLSGLTGAREAADFILFRELFPGRETRNGQLMPFCNREAEKLAEQWGKAAIAGAPSTSVNVCPNDERLRASLPIGLNFLRHGGWGWAALPLTAAVPQVTLGSCTSDHLFAYRWSRRLASQALTCLRPQEVT